MEANEVKSDNRGGERPCIGLGAPEKIALTTLILVLGVSMFVYVARAGTHVVAEFIRAL